MPIIGTATPSNRRPVRPYTFTDAYDFFMGAGLLRRNFASFNPAEVTAVERWARRVGYRWPNRSRAPQSYAFTFFAALQYRANR